MWRDLYITFIAWSLCHNPNRNAHAISLRVFSRTKPIVLADWFSFTQKTNVIIRVAAKKGRARKVEVAFQPGLYSIGRPCLVECRWTDQTDRDKYSGESGAVKMIGCLWIVCK